MSLFRIAIVLSCGVALMPSDKEQQQQLYERAASAAYWTATFCDRNEKTCDTADMLWTSFVAKAQFAGRLGYDIAQRYAAGAEPQKVSLEAPQSAPKAADKAPVQNISVEVPAAGTLKPEDLAPAWRGKNGA